MMMYTMTLSHYYTSTLTEMLLDSPLSKNTTESLLLYPYTHTHTKKISIYPLGDGLLRTECHTYPQLPALLAQCATHTLSWRHLGSNPGPFRP